MKAWIGSNSMTGASSKLLVDGLKVWSFSIAPSGQPVAWVDIYSPDGRHIAKLQKNAWAFNREPYTINTAPKQLQLLDPTGAVCFELQVVGEKLSLVHADLYSKSGVRFTVDSTEPEGPMRVRNSAGDLLAELRYSIFTDPTTEINVLRPGTLGVDEAGATLKAVISRRGVDVTTDAACTSFTDCTFAPPNINAADHKRLHAQLHQVYDGSTFKP